MQNVHAHAFAQSLSSSDTILVNQAIAGNQHAFEALVHQYHTPLFQFVRRYVKDDDEVYDILQHVWLRLYASLPRLSTRDTLKPWLLLVARNHCVDELYRKPARRVMRFSELDNIADEKNSLPLTDIPDPSPSPEELAEMHDLHYTLQQAVQHLPSKFRDVVVLRSTDQLNFAEIGRRLKMSGKTAKTYYYRALPLLRTSLIV